MVLSDKYYLLALFLAQYVIMSLIKIIIWITGRMFPRLGQPQNIILKSLLFVDFYEAWKMKNVVQEIRIPIVSIMYNIGTLFNFIYIVLFLEEAANHSLGIITLESTKSSQIAAFMLTMYFVAANTSSNDAFVKCFQFDQGYRMSFCRCILSICYLYSFIFSQAYLLRALFSLNLIAGAVYLSLKLISTIILSKWISDTNPSALPRVSQNLAYSGDFLKKFFRYFLMLYILAGQTLDIGPFYRSCICKYDVLISSFSVKILRLYQALECFAALALAINSSLSDTQNNSWFDVISGCIISFSAIVCMYYGVICVLTATKYPRYQTIFLDELKYSQIFLLNNNRREDDEVNQQLLQGSLNQILDQLSQNFQNNPFLEYVEFLNRNGNPAEEIDLINQKIIDILVILQQDKRFQQSCVLHPINHSILIENNNSFTLLYLSPTNFPLIVASLKIADAIQPKDFAISLAGNILWESIFSLKRVLIKHILEINTFTANFDALNKDKGLDLIKWMQARKNEQYSNQMSITGYYQIIASFMVNNPRSVLFDLYEID